MKPYLTFSAEDFASDDDFLKWVKYPDRYPELQSFWSDWLHAHPQRREIVEEARFIILAITGEKQYEASAATQAEVWRRIQSSTALPVTQPARIWRPWYSWAAAIVFSVGFGWVILNNLKQGAPSLAKTDTADPEYVQHINNADVPKTIILSDGTSIILHPQTVLEYPRTFGPDTREVHLKGEAFFEVTRDPNRPFLVQAGEIVTRVLGTSFTVRNVEGEDNVMVQVKTGKVSVFMATEMDRRTRNSQQPIDGVVLMPNQQVLYERIEMKMTKSLVENPSVLIPLPRREFEFSDAPIRDVFYAIEQAYGVDIVFDEEALSSCYLNASLTDVPLYDKLKLICRGINTTYEIIDSHIIIYGKGCSEEITNPKSKPNSL